MSARSTFLTIHLIENHCMLDVQRYQSDGQTVERVASVQLGLEDYEALGPELDAFLAKVWSVAAAKQQKLAKVQKPEPKTNPKEEEV